MKLLVVEIKGEPGLLFQGAHPRTYTFVSQDCVTLRADGSFQIDSVKYINLGWAKRNARFNTVDISGLRLFPNESKPIIKSDVPGLDEFLDHLRRGYGARFTASAMTPRGA